MELIHRWQATRACASSYHLQDPEDQFALQGGVLSSTGATRVEAAPPAPQQTKLSKRKMELIHRWQAASCLHASFPTS
eukprot:345858-Chlamydomonas_euryale.AAC.1